MDGIHGTASVTRANLATLGATNCVPSNEELQLRVIFQDFVDGTFYKQLLKSLHQFHDMPAYFHGGQAENIFQSQLDQQVAEDLVCNQGAVLSDPLFTVFSRNLSAKLDSKQQELGNPSHMHHRCFRRSAKFELDSLGQRQFVGVVNRIRRASHVGFPSVGTGFPSTAGLLFATERAADLRSARTNVHVDDPAVGAGRRTEPLRLADVASEDRRCQTLRHAIMTRDCFFERCVTDHVKDRRKRFFIDDPGIIWNLNDRRSHVSSAGRDSSTPVNLPPLGLGLPQCRFHRLGGRTVDKRSDQRPFVEWIADRQFGIDAQ